MSRDIRTLTPLFLKAFGQHWFQQGNVSTFVTPVSHLQPVRAFIEAPSGPNPALVARGMATRQQLAIWMEHADGHVVFTGTASSGLARGEEVTEAERRRIAPIKKVKGALVFGPCRRPIGTTRIGLEETEIVFGRPIGPLFPFTTERKLEIITEWHPWFSAEHGASSPWGRAIVSPEALNQILLVTAPAARWPKTPPVPKPLRSGETGADENGPVLMDKSYRVTRELVGKGETRGTEFTWTRSTLMDPETGAVVAEMSLQDMMRSVRIQTVQKRENLLMPTRGAPSSEGAARRYNCNHR